MRTGVTIVLVFIYQFVSCNIPDSKGTDNVESKNSGLNTAANASYLSPLEKEIVYEINLFRSNPAKYATDYIAPLANNYKGYLLYYPGEKPLRTKEGVGALNECVRVLKREKQVPLLYPKQGLSRAAKDHVKDQSRSGDTGHRGRDRSNVRERIERYGKWKVRIAENIAYGGFSARQIVIYLLVDDGVRDRGHRVNFLHPDYKTIGVAMGSHPGYKTMCVMDFAGDFIEKQRLSLN